MVFDANMDRYLNSNWFNRFKQNDKPFDYVTDTTTKRKKTKYIKSQIKLKRRLK